MVHRLLVTYGPPTDPDAFDRHYRGVHAVLGAGLPGLLRYTIGHCRSLDGTPSPSYLVAEMDFESEEAMQQAMASPAGEAGAADMPNLASGGVSITSFDVVELPTSVPAMP
jgi:uncharacterized protein (TIGR02118 family)